MKNGSTVGWVLIFFFLFTACPAGAQSPPGLTTGQTVYVPAYSHIYSGNNEIPSLLAITLSIRNTDMAHPIQVLAVDYYETSGTLVKHFLSAPLALNALGATRYTIPQKDKAGGSGANFIVTWKAGQPVNPPVIEAVMIGPRASFLSRGQVILPSGPATGN